MMRFWKITVTRKRGLTAKLTTGNLVEKSSETILLSFFKGNRIKRLIKKNSKPLSESKQAKEDKDI